MIGELLVAKRVRVRNTTKVGIQWSDLRALFGTVPNTMLSVTATKRLFDSGTDDARVDHESKRQKSVETPEQQEHSSCSGIKRSTADVESDASC